MNSKFKRIFAGILSTVVVLSTEVPVTLSASAVDAEDVQTENVLTDETPAEPSEEDEECFSTTEMEPIDFDNLGEDAIVSNLPDYFNYLRKSGATDVPMGNNAANYADTLPAEVDNSTNENAVYMPPVKNQGSVGSCVAWAVVYYQYTYMVNKARGIPSKGDANLYSPTFAYNLINEGQDKGSNAEKAYQLLEKHGVANCDDVYPITYSSSSSYYCNWNAIGDTWANALNNKAVSHAFFSKSKSYGYSLPVSNGTPITSSDCAELNSMKAALARGELLSFSSSIGDLKSTTIKTSSDSGVDNRFVGQNSVYAMANYKPDHRMTIVGYNDNIWTDINNNGVVDAGEMGAFKIVNSWGTGTWSTYNRWYDRVTIPNNQGYLWIAYDALNQKPSVEGAPDVGVRNCAFMDVSSVAVSGKKSDSSGIYLRYTLNSADRTKTTVRVIAKNKETGKTYSSVVNPYRYATVSKLGEYSYAGTTTASDGKMAFDLNNVIGNISSDTLADYDWSATVSDSKNDSKVLTVKDIRIVDANANKRYIAQDVIGTELDGTSKTFVIPMVADENPDLSAKIEIPDASDIVANKAFTIKASAEGGIAPYQYRYYYLNKNNSSAQIKDYSDSTSANATINTMGDYTICVSVKDAAGDGKTVSQKINVKDDYVPMTAQLTLPNGKTVYSGQTFRVNLSLTGGVAPYTYSYSYHPTDSYATCMVNGDATGANFRISTAEPEKEYYVCVKVSDSKGRSIAQKEIVKVIGVSIDTLTANKSPIKTNETVKWKATSSFEYPVSYNYTIYNKSDYTLNKTLTTNSDGTADWTPTKAGDYSIIANMVYDGSTIATKEVSFTVEENENSEDTVVIYYKGYSSPYIHYQVGSGSWTTPPGVKMTANTEVSGYTHKYIIKLGTASYANVCFNDGNGNWDSNNSSNYQFSKGSYTYSGGKITPYVPPTPEKLSAKINVGSKYVPTTASIPVTASATGGTSPYQYQYITIENGKETVVKDYSTSNSVNYTFANPGNYTIKVNVKDKTGTIATATTDVAAETVKISSLTADKESVKAGETVKFKAVIASTNVPVLYRYTVTGNNETKTLTTNSDKSASWTPSKEGSYTVKAELLYNNTAVSTKTISYTVEKGDVIADNEVTIYYKGYSSPYIHYQVATGAWTTPPGVKMTSTNEVSGYTHKYTINLGKQTYATVCFNDGNNNWDSNNGANYKFDKGTYTFSNGTITPYNPIPAELSAKVTLGSKCVPVNQSVQINASATGGKAPYQYQYSYTLDGKETVIKAYSTNTSVSFTPASVGTYTVKVTVKDSENKTATATAEMTAATVTINSLTADKTSVKAGQTVKFTVSSSNTSVPVSYRYTVSGNNETKTLTTDSDHSASWTPSKEGSYTVKAELLYNNVSIASKTISYTVEKGDIVTTNEVTIYYKGYSTPYIHYQVGNGTWTTAPGYAMTKTTEVNGYTHKYTIQLNKETFANVCFNDGNNNWDSRNGANYKFEKGTYTFANGTITPYNPIPAELSAKVTLGSQYVPFNQSVSINASAIGGKAPYQYQYSYVLNGKETVIKNYSTSASVDFTPSAVGTYTVKVTVKDSENKTSEATATLKAASVTIDTFTADKAKAKTGEIVRFIAAANDTNVSVTYRYTVNGNGVTQTLTTNSDNSASWTPTKEGVYTVTAVMLYNGNTIASKSISYTIEKGEDVNLNQITIYYKGYATPYIHYQVGSGAWTAVPGKPMTATAELSGYTHKYTIDLGTASYANVCYNDGDNHWDSRNGANYRFTKGIYTYSNGVISTLPNKAVLVTNPMVSNPTISSKTINLGDKITAKCVATGGKGNYKYAFYYKKVTAAKWTEVQSFNSKNTVSFKPAVATAYEVCIKAKDGSGTIQKKYFTVNVQKPLENKSVISATTLKLGSKLTVSAAAAGGTGKYTYAVYYKKSSSSKWTTAQSYKDKNTVTVTPAAATQYDVCVKVKDSNNTIVKQYFTVKVTK